MATVWLVYRGRLLGGVPSNAHSDGLEALDSESSLLLARLMRMTVVGTKRT